MLNITCPAIFTIIRMEKIQIPDYLSLFGRLKDFFDIKMGKNNEITGNETC